MTTATSTPDLAAAVRRGAELLDAKHPGWAAKIAVDRLAMESCDDCILGQLYGHFNSGSVAILFSEPLGPKGCWDAFAPDFERDFPAVAALWRSEIATRLSPPSVPPHADAVCDLTGRGFDYDAPPLSIEDDRNDD